MMHPTRVLARTGLAVLALAGPFLLQSALAADPVAEWAPADSLVFIGIPEVDAAHEAYLKTQISKSLADPALKDYIQPWKKLAENVRDYIAKEIGMENPKDLEIWPHGGLALFVRADKPAGDDEEEARLCLVAEMGKDAERARVIAEKIVQQCVKQGGERTTEEAAGTEVVTIKFRKDDKDESEASGSGDDSDSDSEDDSEDAGDGLEGRLLQGVEMDDMQRTIVSGVLSGLDAPEQFAFAFADTRLVLGSNTATVKDTLVRLRRGSEDTLGSVNDVRAFGRRDDIGRTDLLAVVNLPVIMEAISKDDEDAGKIIPALGADALGPLMFSVQLAPSSEVDVAMRGFMRIDSRPHGLGRILMMENIDTAPPAGVPADSAIYASINLNPQLILEEVLAIAGQIDPDNVEQIEGSLTVPQEDGSTLDIKTDVIGQITGPLTFGLNLAKPFDADHVNLIVRLGHKSRDAMTKLAALLPQGMFMPSEMLGHKVYKTPLLQGMAMGFTERALIPFATQQALESYIRSEGQSDRGLAETAGFKSTLRHVPAQSNAMLYVNGPLVTDCQIAMLEDAPANPMEDPSQASLSNYIRWGMSEGSADQELDVIKATRKYQSHAIMTMRTESDGLRFDFVQVPAKEEAGE